MLAAVLLSGMAGLTWELLWQTHVTFTLGSSVLAASITLSSLMAGLGLGAWLLRRNTWLPTSLRHPLRLYAVAELAVGFFGCCVPTLLATISRLDAIAFRMSPALATMTETLLVPLALVPASIAMGMTIPALAALCDQTKSVSVIYALNTAGAVVGVLVVAFLGIPNLGLARVLLATGLLNLAVGASCMMWSRRWARSDITQSLVPTASDSTPSALSRYAATAFLTGFATFCLEVSWFRSIRAAYQASTETFSILLAGFLIAIAVGASVSKMFRTHFRLNIVATLAAAGILIILTTPYIDALDIETTFDFGSPLAPWLRGEKLVRLFLLPIGTLGLILPTLIDAQKDARGVATLLSVNTFGAMAGAWTSGFLLLPMFGATRTSFIAGGAILLSGLIWTSSLRTRMALPLCLFAALALAHSEHRGSARDRVQGFRAADFAPAVYVHEGPDVTTWVAKEHRTGALKLIIDGFEASGEGDISEHYMRWMGYLPALGAPQLNRALVICFGTGQTANAVRNMGPRSLDIADINRAVFEAARYFKKNEDVLGDPRVHHFVMDGRSLLMRRPKEYYDVVTLEPMPPNFAGANNLYSREFYKLVRTRLTPHGLAAQWLPIHMVTRAHMLAIIATFAEAFPFSRLWIDPIGGTGVLVGSAEPWTLKSTATKLDLTEEQINKGFTLEGGDLLKIRITSPIITDDNQLLAYGTDRFHRTSQGRRWYMKLYQANLDELKRRRRKTF